MAQSIKDKHASDRVESDYRWDTVMARIKAQETCKSRCWRVVRKTSIIRINTGIFNDGYTTFVPFWAVLVSWAVLGFILWDLIVSY